MIRRYTPEELDHLRTIDARDALAALATYAKRDPSFEPLTAKGTERWHVNAHGREFEFLVNGPKFFDTRANTGGGGAIDLVIYVFCLSFTEAVSFLQQRGL